MTFSPFRGVSGSNFCFILSEAVCSASCSGSTVFPFTSFLNNDTDQIFCNRQLFCFFIHNHSNCWAWIIFKMHLKSASGHQHIFLVTVHAMNLSYGWVAYLLSAVWTHQHIEVDKVRLYWEHLTHFFVHWNGDEKSGSRCTSAGKGSKHFLIFGSPVHSWNESCWEYWEIGKNNMNVQRDDVLPFLELPTL